MGHTRSKFSIAYDGAGAFVYQLRDARLYGTLEEAQAEIAKLVSDK